MEPPPPPPPMETSKRRAAATTSLSGLTSDDSVLPIELISEILKRLPVKTLLKMRSVSKSWISLISTPQFIKAHLMFSANNREFAHHRLLSIRSGFHSNDNGEMGKWKDFRTYSLYAILYGESPYFPVEVYNLGVNYEVLDSCDGLFVISKTWYNGIIDLFLWNPSIRKVNKLPYSGNDVCIVQNTFAYGFGYVESQNDYQIVKIVASISSFLIDCISVYSLRSNSWKRIRKFPRISSPKHVKFVKGKLHWINGDSDSNATWFNPGDEKFGNVALPNPSGDTNNWKLVSYRNKTDVWIMKEYGLADSWTIVASIPKFVNKAVWPIFVSHDDEILLQDVSGLVWWHVSRDDDTVDRPENQTLCECDKGKELNLYFESLVSPNSS